MPPSSSHTGRPAYDSRRLRRIFDRRAATFGEVAFLPREIAQRMRERNRRDDVGPLRAIECICGERREARREFACKHQTRAKLETERKRIEWRTVIGERERRIEWRRLGPTGRASIARDAGTAR